MNKINPKDTKVYRKNVKNAISSYKRNEIMTIKYMI